MNISTISFQGRQDNDFDIPSWVNQNHPQNRTSKDSVRRGSSDIHSARARYAYQQEPASRLERTPRTDSFSRTGGKNGKSSKRGVKIPAPLKTFALGILTSLAVVQGSNMINQPAQSVTVPVDSSTSLVELADLYDSDIDAILNYNNLASSEDLALAGEIVIPSAFDYLQEEIDKLQDKLYNKDLSEQERADIEAKLAAYQEKQELQQSIATSYTDGKYVYYTINELPDGNSSINVETFKDIFDIKDGALRKYNDLDYVWARDEDAPPEDRGYRDYTGERLHVGQTVKVRPGDIELDAGE